MLQVDRVRLVSLSMTPLLLTLAACSSTALSDRSDRQVLSSKRLASALPAALPPPQRATSDPVVATPAGATSQAPVVQAAPSQPTSTVVVQAPAAVAAQAPGVPAPASSPAMSTPVLAPLPDGEVGQGIRAGQCWAQLLVEPQVQRRTIDVVTQDGVTRLSVRPPELRTEPKDLVVKESAQTFKVQPPRFRQVVEQVLVKEEVRRLVVVPAVYETQEEKVQVESARVVLENCRASAQRAAGASVKAPYAKCAREIPARFEAIPRRVLVQPETTREEITPAQYASVTKWVLEEPARAVPETLPATTQQIQVTEVAKPAEVAGRDVPPAKRALEVAEYQGMPQLVWRRALCESDAGPAVVSSVQKALRERGLDVGAVDGKLGRRTMSALMSFQREEGLAVGLLTFESLARLGVPSPAP